MLMLTWHIPTHTVDVDVDVDVECLATWKDGMDLFVLGRLQLGALSVPRDIKYRCIVRTSLLPSALTFEMDLVIQDADIRAVLMEYKTVPFSLSNICEKCKQNNRENLGSHHLEPGLTFSATSSWPQCRQI